MSIKDFISNLFGGGSNDAGAQSSDAPMTEESTEAAAPSMEQASEPMAEETTEEAPMEAPAAEETPAEEASEPMAEESTEGGEEMTEEEPQA